MYNIEIKDLTYRYPTSEEDILKNVSLSVKKGELCALVGANGSGKTTLCNAIRGFVPKFYKGDMTGEVYIKGNNIADMDVGSIALDVGFVFQNPFTQISGIASQQRRQADVLPLHRCQAGGPAGRDEGGGGTTRFCRIPCRVRDTARMQRRNPLRRGRIPAS